MDDSIKRIIEESNKLKKLTETLDLGQKLGSKSASDSLAKQLASVQLPKVFALPPLSIAEQVPIRLPHIRTFEENNGFQSAGILLRRLANSISQWRAALPDDVQPAVIAILSGGIQINVDRLAQESFHGIRIEGRLEGSPCLVLAHQSTIQLLCFVQPIKPPERPRRSIGFVIDGEESQV